MNLATRLSERVAFQGLFTQSDDYGGVTESWKTQFEVYAEVKPVLRAERERVSAEQYQATAGYRVIIRARTDVRANMRILWKSHILMIHSLHETDETLNLLCYEDNL